MDSWVSHSELAEFRSLEQVFGLQGERVDRSPISEIFRIRIQDKIYYVKRYHQAGKHLRRFFGRSRIKAEWDNLLFFRELGIPCATALAYGELRHWGGFQRGAMVMPELENTLDLADMAMNKHALLQNSSWVKALSNNLAKDTAKIHQYGFIHVDLKWRNILIDVKANLDHPQHFFIDCPSGQIQYGFLRSRGIVKDLACLDKWAKQVLSQKQRLYFFRQYLGVKKFSLVHRRMLVKIEQFFQGRA